MKQYVIELCDHFGSTAALAKFAGFPLDTVKSWRVGRREPRGVDLRLIQVLGSLLVEAPWLFESIVSAPAKPVVKLPILPPLVVQQAASRWSDDYWHARTTASPDDEPACTVTTAELDQMSEADERAWVVSLNSYLARTGRTYPD